MSSSHRLVCDLLDERYFDNLQDVIGNVVPIPTLVPYHKYEQNVIVYRTVADHTKFMAMIQNFCDRTARQYGRELWSWAVQWDVEDLPVVQTSGVTPAFKKLRLETPTTAACSTPRARARNPHYTVLHRKLDPELMKEEDMLRITIDIVQIKPHLVPNFIEFLYRWIDFYEGDGTALKLAMHEEIPSLWDFEHNPVVLLKPEDKNGNNTERRKPDLKAFEELAAKSERLQYKEARFGLQAVKEDMMSPLINVPKDLEKRKKYYAACYKSRSKAIYLLKEAGITEKQIANYTKQQKAHPKKTPEEGEGEGWKWYDGEKVKAEEHQRELRRWAVLKKKCREGLLSIKLKSEADQVTLQALNIATQSGRLVAAPPIIPRTLPYTLPPQPPSVNRKRHATDRLSDESIKVVPVHLFGMLNSRRFDDAIPSDAVDRDNGSENNEEDEGMEGTEDEEGNMDATPSAAPIPTNPLVLHSSALPTAPPQGPVNATNIISLLQSLSPAQVMRMLPLLGSQDRQRMVQRLMALPAPQTQVETVNAGNLNLSTAPQVSIEPPQSAQGMLGMQHASQLSLQMAQFQAWAITQRTQPAGAINGVQPLQRSPMMPTRPTLLQPPPNRQVLLHTGLPEAIQQPRAADLSTPQPFSTLLANRIRTASLQPGFAPPLPGLKRKAPLGLSITPNPFVAPLPRPAGIPIQFYFPKIADYASTTIGIDVTDALMLGFLHTTPSGDEEIEFTHLILLPMSVSQNCINRVQEGQYTVLESYTPANMRSVTGRVYTPAVGAGGVAGKAHKAAYEKIKQAFSFMQDGMGRENILTKRWRATQGMMTEDERGSVWEGWAVSVSMKIAMSAEEREGAYVPNGRKGVAEDEDEWNEDEDTDEDEDEDEDGDMKSD